MKPLHSLTDTEFERELQRAVAELPDAPAAMVQAAIGLFPARPPPWQAAVQAAREGLQAVLTFDSWAAPALAGGMRSGADPTRYLLYSVDGCDIDLRITPEAAGFALAGQILGPEAAGRVELLPAGEAALPQTAQLDEMGEFRFHGLRGGSYRFSLHFASGAGIPAIELPALEVGERPA